MSSQNFSLKSLRKVLREGDILDVPIENLVDFSELSSKELVGFIRESIAYRKRSIKRFKDESERTLQKHMRLPPSMRKKKRVKKNGKQNLQSQRD